MTHRPEIDLRALLEAGGTLAGDAVALIDAHARQTTAELRDAIAAIRDLLYLPFAADGRGRDMRADLALARADAARPLLDALARAYVPHATAAITSEARRALEQLPVRYRVLGTPEEDR
ncbi:hypothetical protein GCM10010433_05730 [Streptomyces pulveraceus]|uniref:Uncharacterized protein n=1 Tax=Streptomyces pulveraceus TaxID=68258 RepID=A0ABW1GMQ1_9ACTN